MHIEPDMIAATGPLDPLLWASGAAILVLIVRLLKQPGAWDEAAKYEMLGLERPEAPAPETKRSRAGRLGVEDRIVRFSLSMSCSYLALTSGNWAAGLTVGLLALYALLTSLAGRDPLYRRLGLCSDLTPN